MVLVQEDKELQEHIVHYLSRNLIDAELHYTYVEKLALATVHVVQRLRHYILLRQTLVVAHINPFQLVLTIRMMGGNIINGLLSCKSSTSNLFYKNQINH